MKETMRKAFAEGRVQILHHGTYQEAVDPVTGLKARRRPTRDCGWTDWRLVAEEFITLGIYDEEPVPTITCDVCATEAAATKDHGLVRRVPGGLKGAREVCPACYYSAKEAERTYPPRLIVTNFRTGDHSHNVIPVKGGAYAAVYDAYDGPVALGQKAVAW